MNKFYEKVIYSTENNFARHIFEQFRWTLDVGLRTGRSGWKLDVRLPTRNTN